MMKMKLLDFHGPRARSEGRRESLAVSELQAAESCCVNGKFTESLPHLDRAVQIEPTNALHHANRSLVNLSLGTVIGFRAGLLDAKKAVELAPTWHRGHYRQGLALRALRQFASAIRSLNCGLELARSELAPASGSLESTGRDSESHSLEDMYSAAFDAATSVISEFSVAIEETGKLASADGPGLIDHEGAEVEADEAAEGDVFNQVESWLAEGSNFPFLYMRRYGEGSRGVHARCDVPAETELLAVGQEYLITVEMGRACPIGRKIAGASIERDLSAAKHCYLTVFALWDRRNQSSFFQPYYRILPANYPNMPIFWTPDELQYLQGSYILQQIADRKANISADYELICRHAPDMRNYTLEEFCWGRMMVASRNFGIVVDGVRTDALVPYADMLNHYRPRQTRWAFDNRKRQFVITSLQGLHAGQQIYDSYGKKCNSRFLLNYGFSVDFNTDEDVGQNHNEVRLVLAMSPADGDILHTRRLEVCAGLLLEQFDTGPAPADASSSAPLALTGAMGSLSLGGAGARSASADRAGTSTPSPPTASSLCNPLSGGRLRGSYLASASKAIDALDIVGNSHMLAGNVQGRDYEGTAVQRGAIVGRAVRVSTYYDSESTTEAFSWLRLLHASGPELSSLLPMEDDADLLRRPVRPLSTVTEAAVLRHMASACAAQLSAYPTTAAEDAAELASGRWPYGSNKRNAVVLLLGEKEVCGHFIRLAQEAMPYLSGPASRLPMSDVKPLVLRTFAGPGDVDRYMRNVVLPLLKRQEDGLTAGGPIGPGGVAPPPVPTGPGFGAIRAGTGSVRITSVP